MLHMRMHLLDLLLQRAQKRFATPMEHMHMTVGCLQFVEFLSDQHASSYLHLLEPNFPLPVVS